MPLILACICAANVFGGASIEPARLNEMQIMDEFWGPKLEIWRNVTVPDCFDKFEKDGAITNFDRVRDGLTGEHGGAPWCDGLTYEMIRASADFLAARPDAVLESRLDGYIERIAAAAEKDPDGYIDTYTQLSEPAHRWGLNGGYERISHDLYNAGALVEAGVHYYKATGKTRLLTVAARMANLMFKTMGPPPKRNIIPSHPLAEEAVVKLYELFRDEPDLKSKVEAPANENDYLALAEFWIEARGHNCGKPDWNSQSEAECQKQIRDCVYGDDRPSWGVYAQDHQPVLDQQTIEGHAVRATLLCAGVAAAAFTDSRADYATAAERLWTNMTERKTHLTGGVGAFANDEKFGPDYVLPNDAYLETCAAVGAGFFHWNMFLLNKDGKYLDELERVLFNGVLSGISLKGDSYFYENPLASKNRNRWKWHGCPCCPPMFLKIMAAMPGYAYATDESGLYVNLFVGSRFSHELNGRKVEIIQETKYPWDGKVALTINVDPSTEFELRVRAPGWSSGFPFEINGAKIPDAPVDHGFARIKKTWNKGDCVTFEIPLPVRLVSANPKVEADLGRAAIMRGPIVYCVESAGNSTAVNLLTLSRGVELKAELHPELLGGVVEVTGKALVLKEWTGGALYRDSRVEESKVDFSAIPFYANSNREPGELAVWLPILE
jgi:DUF1680 family protein